MGAGCPALTHFSAWLLNVATDFGTVAQHEVKPDEWLTYLMPGNFKPPSR